MVPFSRKDGSEMYHIVQPGESMQLIAANYRIPYHQLLLANPAIVNPSVIYIGQQIVIPGLPNSSDIPYSIVVSKEKRTLSLFKNRQLVKTYPIAIGKMLTTTPVGQFVIVNREPNPGGPFGALWLSLSKKGYGIHGTNDPSSIGKAVSKGCIRMHNSDVLELASLVPNGTSVVIT